MELPENAALVLTGRECMLLERSLVRDLRALAVQDGGVPAELDRLHREIRLAAERFRRSVQASRSRVTASRANGPSAGIVDDASSPDAPAGARGPHRPGSGEGLTTAAVATRAGCSEGAVRRALREARLPGWRVAGSWRVDPTDAERYARGRLGGDGG